MQLSKNLDMTKNQATISTHFYYTKQQPVSKVQNITDNEQQLAFRVQTYAKPVSLAHTDLVFEVESPAAENYALDQVLMFSALKGILQGLVLYTGSGQKLFNVDKHLWAWAQIKQLHDSESAVDQNGEIYESRDFNGNLGAAELSDYNLDTSVIAAVKRAYGIMVSENLNTAGTKRVLQFKIPLSKLGGIFDTKQGLMVFTDDLLEFDFKLMKKNECFCKLTSGGASAALVQDLIITDCYLNVARSRDEQINQTLIRQVQDGVVFPYQYISCKYDSLSSTTANINHSITINEGIKLHSITTAFINNNQTIAGFHGNNTVQNMSGFIGQSLAKQAGIKETYFNNETISIEKPFLQSHDSKMNVSQLKGRYHTYLPLTDDYDQLDSGFDLSNLPSTNYQLTHYFADTALLPGKFATTFFNGIQYVKQSQQNIKTQGQ